MSDLDIARASDLHRLERKIDALLDQIKPRDEWLSVHDYAAEKGVTVSTVRRWILSGQVEARGAGKLRRVKLV